MYVHTSTLTNKKFKYLYICAKYFCFSLVPYEDVIMSGYWFICLSGIVCQKWKYLKEAWPAIQNKHNQKGKIYKNDINSREETQNEAFADCK